MTRRIGGGKFSSPEQCAKRAKSNIGRAQDELAGAPIANAAVQH